MHVDKAEISAKNNHASVRLLNFDARRETTRVFNSVQCVKWVEISRYRRAECLSASTFRK